MTRMDLFPVIQSMWVGDRLTDMERLSISSFLRFVKVRSRYRPSHYIKKYYHVTNWFLRAPSGSRIMEYCYSEAAERDPETIRWGETGPTLVNHAVEKYNMRRYIVQEGTIFSVWSWQWKQFIKGARNIDRKWKSAGSSAFGVHLYNEMWRRNGIDKNGEFPQDSIYERLKHRYLNGTLTPRKAC